VKNIVLCFDRARDHPGPRAATNAEALLRLLEESDEQVTWYHPGTRMAAADERRLARLRWREAAVDDARATIAEAYEFLVDWWEPGDRIFMFGVGRGAYCAHALTRLLSVVGVLPDLMDYVLAEQSAFLTLPARKEGIIPGAANMRLPRFTGDRIARQAIQYERRLECDSPEGRLICDEIVPTGAMDAAIERVVSGLTSSGVVSAASNRRAFRITQEPLDTFRSYFAVYAREQAYCHFSPALISNLELYWNAQNRRA